MFECVGFTQNLAWGEEPPEKPSFLEASDRILRRLSIEEILNLSEKEAEILFALFRWPSSGGKPICPDCHHPEVFSCRRPNRTARWRCRGCQKDITLTQGTVLQFRKMKIRQYIQVAWFLANTTDSLLSISRILDINYLTIRRARLTFNVELLSKIQPTRPVKPTRESEPPAVITIVSMPKYEPPPPLIEISQPIKPQAITRSSVDERKQEPPATEAQVYIRKVEMKARPVFTPYKYTDPSTINQIRECSCGNKFRAVFPAQANCILCSPIGIHRIR